MTVHEKAKQDPTADKSCVLVSVCVTQTLAEEVLVLHSHTLLSKR